MGKSSIGIVRVVAVASAGNVLAAYSRAHSILYSISDIVPINDHGVDVNFLPTDKSGCGEYGVDPASQLRVLGES
jgi:hypothetical protein